MNKEVLRTISNYFKTHSVKKSWVLILSILFLIACSDGRKHQPSYEMEYGEGEKNEVPIDGGHGIGIDTATVNEIQRLEDSMPAKGPATESPKKVSPSREFHEPDNMRGFDPASEDDMDDNGMSRYMDNYDDEGWD